MTDMRTRDREGLHRPIRRAGALRRGDRMMMVIFLLLLSATFLLYIYRSFAQGPEALRAEVMRDGVVLQQIDLDGGSGTREFVFESPLGRNVVRAEGRQIAISDADCPDRDCVRMGWLRRPGDSAVCLPHRFILRIRGAGGVDAVTF